MGIEVQTASPALFTDGQAIGHLSVGKPIAAATESAYALAVDAFNVDAVRRVRAIKREHSKPILLLIDSVVWLHRLGHRIPDVAWKLTEAHWPGQLTIIIPADHLVNLAVTAGSGTVGLRVPAHAGLRRLIHAFGKPITGTSFNLAGHPPASTAAEVTKAIRGVDCWGECILPGGPPSTVVDLSGAAPSIVRQGALKLDLA